MVLANLDKFLFKMEDSTPASSDHTYGSEPVLKRCPKCQLEQSLGEFYSSIKTKDGLSFCCKTCFKGYRKRPLEVEPDSDACNGRAESSEGPDSLYIMENTLLPGMVKIGRSACPEERAKQLAASHPFRLIVQYSYGEKGYLEKTLHERLKHRRVEGGVGREWFRLTAEQADTLVKASIVDHELS